MSVTYPDLPLTVSPDAKDTLLNLMDVDLEALPYATQYHTFIYNGDLAGAQGVLLAYPRLKQMGITAEHINALDQRIIAMQRFVLANQQQMQFSATQPTFQNNNDVWAKVIATDVTRYKIEFYRKTATGYLLMTIGANTIEFADGKTAETKLGGIDGISDLLTGTSSRIAASQKAVNDINNSLNAEWTLIGSVTGTTQLNFTVGTYKKLKVRVYNNVTGTTMQVLEKEVDVQFLSDTRYRYGDAAGTNIQANAFFGMMVDIKLSSVKLGGSHSYTTDCTATATVELWGK